MSSLGRRIQRQVSPSQKVHRDWDEDKKKWGPYYANPPRQKFYQGRGSRLGFVNEQDPCRVKREEKANG